MESWSDAGVPGEKVSTDILTTPKGASTASARAAGAEDRGPYVLNLTDQEKRDFIEWGLATGTAPHHCVVSVAITENLTQEH